MCKYYGSSHILTIQNSTTEVRPKPLLLTVLQQHPHHPTSKTYSSNRLLKCRQGMQDNGIMTLYQALCTMHCKHFNNL